MRVVRKWFGYRKRHPEVRVSSALNDIRPISWEAEVTTELLNLLTVLSRLVALEPAQADMLARTLASPLITVDELEEVGVFPVPSVARKPRRHSRFVTDSRQGTLSFDQE
jgi:hypothetical protein